MKLQDVFTPEAADHYKQLRASKSNSLVSHKVFISLVIQSLRPDFDIFKLGAGVSTPPARVSIEEALADFEAL